MLKGVMVWSCIFVGNKKIDMKGLYITEDGRRELESKIAEIEEQLGSKDMYLTVWYGLNHKKIMLKEILSTATILPVEDSWGDIKDMLDINTLPISYKQGVIIETKE
jgi:hypothetical protein